MGMINKLKFDEEYFENRKKERYEESQKDKNNLSYWFPEVKNCGIPVPETLIIPIDYNQFKWFLSDSYSEEGIDAMSLYINQHIAESNLKGQNKLFIKTGTFSNKFQYDTCKVEDLSKIGRNILDVYYGAMCVGAGESTEIVVREFIESKANVKTIYNGMPLNTEFRVFYDFDKKEVLGVFNYWDKETMINGLKYPCYAEDLKTFISYADIIEESYNKHKETVVEMVSDAMNNVQLTGRWSVDIMMAQDKFYLIDMAIAEKSYYYEKLSR